MKLFSRILSVVFHPLLLPTYAIALIIVTNPYLFAVYRDYEWIFVLRVFLNTFAFPALASVLLWRLGFIDSLKMETREERIIPFIATGTFYVWTYVSFRKSPDPQVMNIVLLGACITVFACFLANLINKISIHAAGMGCFAVVVMYTCAISSFDLRWMLLAAILLAGVMGTIRLFLGSHTPRQVAAGYLIGITAQMVALKFI